MAHQPRLQRLIPLRLPQQLLQQGQELLGLANRQIETPRREIAPCHPLLGHEAAETVEHQHTAARQGFRCRSRSRPGHHQPGTTVKAGHAGRILKAQWLHLQLRMGLRPGQQLLARRSAPAAEGHHPDAPCQRPQRFEQADVIVGAIRAAAEHHQRARLRSGGRMLQFLHKTGIQERAQRRRRQMPVPPAPHLFGDIRCKGPEGFAAAAQPVTAEAKATIELRATGDAAQPRQQPLSQIKVASVDVGMGGNQQIGLQAQQQRNHVIATEAEGAWFPQVFEFHQSPIQLVQPGGMPLNPVVELHTTTGDRAGVLQHMLNPHFTLWIPPLNPGLQGVGRRVMGGAAAGGENQDAHRIPPFTSVPLRSELVVPTTP